MKIKDITEGLYDYITKMNQQKIKGNWARGTADKKAYIDQYERNVDQANRDYQTKTKVTTPDPTPAEEPQAIANPQEGSVFLVTASNGNTYFKTYTGSWHIKGKSATDFSVGGTKVTEPKDTAALDKLLPTARLVGVKPDPRDASGNAWMYDQRKTALLARRSGKK